MRGWWYTVGERVDECPMEYRKKESEVTVWQERACEMNCRRVTFQELHSEKYIRGYGGDTRWKKPEF